jgi:HEAT repeat protein
MRALLLGLLLLPPPGEGTLITRAGEKLQGRITRIGDDYLVESPAGSRRIPASDVTCQFAEVREAVQRAEDQFRQAKALFEAAEKREASDPSRNDRILRAIDLAQQAAALHRALEPHYPGQDHGRQAQVVQQFLRLARSAATSDRAGGPAPAGQRTVALLDPQYAAEAPAPEAARPWILKGDLGPGMAALARDLAHPDPTRRLAAVKLLSHPPAVAHLPALLKLFEGEKAPDLVQAIAEGLTLHDPGPLIRPLSWARQDPDPVKRGTLLALCRLSGDRAAFDFLANWFVDAPPAAHPDRAAFASAFRQFHATAVPELKELLTKHRNPKVQSEILKQMGVIGDPSFAPMLIKAIPAYARDAAVALSKIGKPALPILMEGCRSNDQETRRVCVGICRRLTRTSGYNVDHFEKWWAANRKAVLEEEKSQEEEAARRGWAVDPGAFAAYDLPLEAVIR